VNSIAKSSIIQFINGRSCLLVGDSNILKNNKKQEFHLRNYWIKKGIKVYNSIQIDDNNFISEGITKNFYYKKPFIAFAEKRILIVDKKARIPDSPVRFKVDIVVVSNAAKISIERINSSFDAGIIIFDSSNPKWYIDKKTKEAQQLNVPVYSVTHSGAYQKKM